jgi:hypothetical protein
MIINCPTVIRKASKQEKFILAQFAIKQKNLLKMDSLSYLILVSLSKSMN